MKITLLIFSVLLISVDQFFISFDCLFRSKHETYMVRIDVTHFFNYKPMLYVC